MKYPLRNLLMLSLGISFLLTHVPLAHAQKTATPPTAKAKGKAGPTVTSASLVMDMKKSIAFITKSAKGKISTKSKTARPFWSAIKDCNAAIAQIEKGQKAKDITMLKGLNALGESVPQLSASWGILRGSHKDLQVGRGVIALTASYDSYVSNFGPSAARKKKGGNLTAKETARFNESKAAVAKHKAKIAKLKSKAKPKSNELRLANDLILLVAQLDRIAGGGLAAYCDYLYYYDRLSYTTRGYGDIIEVWYPSYYSEWSSYETEVSASWSTYSEESYSYYESWDYSSVSVSESSSYYESTSSVSSITTEEISSSEEYSEEYSEVTATEESSEESSEIVEEIEASEESSDETFADSVADGDDDADGDGIDDEADTDEDNDGVSNEADTDDDGDNIADTEEEPETEVGEEVEADGAAEVETESDGGGEEMEEEAGAEEAPAAEEVAAEEEEPAEEEPAEEEAAGEDGGGGDDGLGGGGEE